MSNEQPAAAAPAEQQPEEVSLSNARPEHHSSRQDGLTAAKADAGGGRGQLHLRWEEVTFDVDDTFAVRDKGEPVPVKRILHGVTGQVAPGQVACIMGPSGSGKTSLLNILAGNTTHGLGGRVLANGREPPKGIKRFVGYVTQDDSLIPALTVFETLDYAAQLKLPVETTPAERRARVDAVIRELDLERVRDTRVGVVGAGISGGERRRLTIAIEILNQPALLLLDEPTSGLDAASALLIVRLLQRLAATLHSSILCTVHQPRASVLRAFDAVLLLGLGRTVYFGPTGDELLAFFRSCGYECPPFDNPADWMLDLINTKKEAREALSKDPRMEEPDLEAAGVPEGDRAAIITSLNAAYLKSEVCGEATRAPEKYPPPLRAGGDASATASKYITPWANQTSVVLRRSFFHKLREPMAAMTQAFNATLMPLLVGVIFFRPDDTVQGASNRMSALSLMMILQGFFAFDTILLFPMERTIYQRENRAGLYSTSAFYMGRTTAELPFHVAFTFVASCIFYGLLGLRSGADHFFLFVLIIELVTLCGASLLLLIGAMAKGFEESNLMASMALIVLMLFDGNWVPIDDIPAPLRWIHHLSFMNHGVAASIHNELDGTFLTCSAADKEGGRCVEDISGADFLDSRDFGDVNVAEKLAILLAMTVGYRVLAYFALRFMHTGRSFKDNLRA